MKRLMWGVLIFINAFLSFGVFSLYGQQIVIENKTVDTNNNDNDALYMDFDISEKTDIIITFSLYTRSDQIYADNADVWIPFRKRYGLRFYLSKDGAAVTQIDKIINPDWMISGGPDANGKYLYYDPTRYTVQFTLSDLEPGNYKVYFERYENPGSGDLRTGTYAQQFPVLHHDIYGSAVMNKSISPELLQLLQDEANARAAGDAALAQQIQDVIDLINAEAVTRAEKDQELLDLINAETEARKAGDEELAAKIEAEVEQLKLDIENLKKELNNKIEALRNDMEDSLELLRKSVEENNNSGVYGGTGSNYGGDPSVSKQDVPVDKRDLRTSPSTTLDIRELR